jgi:hypothetical protein
MDKPVTIKAIGVGSIEKEGPIPVMNNILATHGTNEASNNIPVCFRKILDVLKKRPRRLIVPPISST